MNPTTIGLLGIALLLLCLAFRMSIGISMGVTGLAGLIMLRGWEAGLNLAGSVPYQTATTYTMSTIPLFVLMGNFAFYSGVSQELFLATRKWLGQMPGGLAIATAIGSAAFAAVSGSSVANAVTMGTVSLPEMKQYRYAPSLATGCVAAGGTLGILIPPSIGFIFYSMLTNESILKLFIAGILPGALLALLFSLAILVLTRGNPLLGPPGPRTTIKEKIFSLKGVWIVLVLFVVVIGGMYVGVFTPTEAAGVGAFISFIILVAKQGLKKRKIIDSLMDTGKMVAMCYLILTGATIFSYFVAFSRLPFSLAQLIIGMHIPTAGVLAFVIAIYLLLGCVMDTLSMIILTVPIFFPVITSIGLDPVWFGVVIVLTMEMGLITPPVGINVFVIKGISKEIPMQTIFRGVIPFFICMLVCVIILYVFPQVVLFLPNLVS